MDKEAISDLYKTIGFFFKLVAGLFFIFFIITTYYVTKDGNITEHVTQGMVDIMSFNVRAFFTMPFMFLTCLGFVVLGLIFDNIVGDNEYV